MAAERDILEQANSALEAELCAARRAAPPPLSGVGGGGVRASPDEETVQLRQELVQKSAKVQELEGELKEALQQNRTFEIADGRRKKEQQVHRDFLGEESTRLREELRSVEDSLRAEQASLRDAMRRESAAERRVSDALREDLRLSQEALAAAVLDASTNSAKLDGLSERLAASESRAGNLHLSLELEQESIVKLEGRLRACAAERDRLRGKVQELEGIAAKMDELHGRLCCSEAERDALRRLFGSGGGGDGSSLSGQQPRRLTR